MKTPPTYQRVYVWELPVRLTHWVNAACILTLGASGLLIAHPLGLNHPQEASSGYWFGVLRFIHFSTAYIFVASLAIRLYWAFAGNTFARWYNFFPLSRRQLKDSVTTIKVEMLQVSNKPMDFIGHNPIAYYSYTLVFLLSAFQVISGFALYSPMSSSWFPRLFPWIIPLFGSEETLRHYHYEMTWVFILFIVVHLYLVAYQEQVEGNGALSSIVGGWKFLRRRGSRAATVLTPIAQPKSAPKSR